MTTDPNIYFVCKHWKSNDGRHTFLDIYATSAPDFKPTDDNLIGSMAFDTEVFPAFQRKFYAHTYIDLDEKDAK